MTKDNAAPQTGQAAQSKRRRPVVSWFFWGTIGALSLGTIGLQIAANRQVAAPGPDAPQVQRDADPQALTQKMIEQVGQVLTDAPTRARTTAEAQIKPLVDEAFRPVYDAIPKYADFHYSIRGEYTELVFAAVGTLAPDLESRLFTGLSDRLTTVSSKVDDLFVQTYTDELRAGVGAVTSSVDLGRTITAATQNAVKRAGVSTAVSLGGAASLKVISKTVATKLSGKIAAKVAGKGLVKGGSVLSGAGAGAAVCSPSGPVAALCGVIGGAIAWVVVDAVVIGLDELMNREEFENDLRQAIDLEKARIAQELAEQLRTKEQDLLRAVPQQTADLTLAQLSDAALVDICTKAGVLQENFRRIQTELAARSPENLRLFREDLAQLEADGSGLLKATVTGMRASIDSQAQKLNVKNVSLGGNFRTDDHVDRKLSIRINVGGTGVELDGVKATKSNGFYAEAPLKLSIDPSRELVATAAIEQKRHLRDRFFGGKISVRDPIGSLAWTQGLRGGMRLKLPVVRDENAGSLDAVQRTLAGPTALMDLRIEVVAERLADVLPLQRCAEVEAAGGSEG